jgi:glutamate 5-kinase
MNKIVIKIGTSSLTQGNTTPSRRYLLGLVQQIAHLQGLGLQPILVSSGAVATGRAMLNLSKANPSPLLKQTLASIGQVRVMQVWSELFSLFDLQVGQLLLTKENFSDRHYSSLQETLDCLLRHQVIPIINENDTAATNEAVVGDNDNLAALVAKSIGADTLILLTDQEGLYTADPRQNPEAKLISHVAQIDEKILSFAGDATDALGTGGMAAKIKAAKIASHSKTQTIIASARHPNILIDLLAGKHIGTLISEETHTHMTTIENQRGIN